MALIQIYSSLPNSHLFTNSNDLVLAKRDEGQSPLRRPQPPSTREEDVTNYYGNATQTLIIQS